MSSSPSLIETLIENSKYISSNEVNEPSACETRCQTQQAALVSCMESIRQQQHHNNEESPAGERNKCLSPAVAAWTECCANANNEA